MYMCMHVCMKYMHIYVYTTVFVQAREDVQVRIRTVAWRVCKTQHVHDVVSMPTHGYMCILV